MTMLSWWFRVKAWLGGLGLVVGIIGMALGLRFVVGVSVGLLAIAFLARFAEKKSS